VTTPRPHLLGLFAGLLLSGALVLSSALLTRTWMKVADAESISVTGSARRNVSSDLVVWQGTVTVEGSSLLQAQSTLREHTDTLLAFFKANKVTNAALQPILITRLSGQVDQGQRTYTTNRGFRLSRTAVIRSANIDTVLAMDATTGNLVQEGIEFSSAPPEFIWTKAGEAKVEMLADATRDAKERALQIASQGNRTISRLKSARMGVFQITPLFSTQNAWDGMNDTGSREKTVTAVIHANFALN
jgi:uncharacterized protein